MANNTLDLGKVSAVEGEDLSVLEHVTYNSEKGQLDSDCPVVETMEDYSFEAILSDEQFEMEYIYAGIVKNGNKLTFVICGNITKLVNTASGDNMDLGNFNIPASIGAKLFPYQLSGINVLSNGLLQLASSFTQYVNVPSLTFKQSGRQISNRLYNVNSLMEKDTKYLFRLEKTFLLSDNLVSNE